MSLAKLCSRIVFLSLVGISIHLKANEFSSQLVRFWLDGRFQNCDQGFVDRLIATNGMTLYQLTSGICAGVNLNDFKSEKTVKCFKQTDKDLSIALTKFNPSSFSCQANPNYKDYLTGSTQQVPVVDVFDANVVCKATDKNPFAYYKVDAVHNSCVKKFNCDRKFKFGSSNELAKGDYIFRCALPVNIVNPNAPCADVKLLNCIQESYSELNFIGKKSDPVYVKPSSSGVAK